MFGFSIFKIIFTIAVVVLVWQGFKWLKRRDSMLDARNQESVSRKSPNANDDFEEMLQCPDCGAFVAKGSGHTCA